MAHIWHSLHPERAVGHNAGRRSDLESVEQNSRGVAQPGSAPALGAGGPRFKSARPDQFSFPSLNLTLADQGPLLNRAVETGSTNPMGVGCMLEVSFFAQTSTSLK